MEVVVIAATVIVAAAVAGIVLVLVLVLALVLVHVLCETGGIIEDFFHRRFFRDSLQ